MSAICEAVQACCVCTLAEGHDGPHACVCGGSWEHVDGKFRVHAWPTAPQPGSFAEIEPAVYALLCDWTKANYTILPAEEREPGGIQ